MKTAARWPANPATPPLIIRNTRLLALSQAFTGSGWQLAFALGPLMVIALTDSASLTGLSVGFLGLSRFLVAYPAGKITDMYGRRPGMILGLALGFAGAILLGAGMLTRAFPVFVVGLLVFGMGMNAAQQLRVAATDMYPPNRRAEALGYVLMGSLIGVVISPGIVSVGEVVAHRVGTDPLGVPWLLLPLLIVPGMVLVSLVRPDPREIGSHLERYYPAYLSAELEETGRTGRGNARALLGYYPTRVAIVANFAAQGNMSIVMVLTSLVLSHHGHSLAAITVALALHSAGMWTFSLPFGRLADRFGRRAVLLPGVIVSLVGAGLVAFTDEYWPVALGAFFVGLGWSAVNVTATVLIADHTVTIERGRAIGVNDSFAGAATIAMAAVTGPTVEHLGLPATGLLAVALVVVPLLMLILWRTQPERRGPLAAVPEPADTPSA